MDARKWATCLDYTHWNRSRLPVASFNSVERTRFPDATKLSDEEREIEMQMKGLPPIFLQLIRVLVFPVWLAELPSLVLRLIGSSMCMSDECALLLN
jgi:hypothetical protein